MRASLALMLVALLAPIPGMAEDPDTVPQSDRAAIRQVIQHQMEAFRRDDGPAAFAFASPGIQSHFSNDPGVFMDMVRRLYQPVYRPRDTTFGPVTEEQGQIVQHVLVTGPDGARSEALYFMEHEGDGSWRISGCMLTKSASVGT